ncbi:glycosyltransferase family 4 protein [Anoxybacillus salavatliensis]|uniref:glycosyltransferase family 4 protein n=1 Tax=Anoxybacillus gonensis TaxID=198467 RepID=UPI00214B59BF|nr:glycosyltransferase family 4 protein [Anoxybacillus gonensis]MCQ5363560.1 glycosyltransferase family 4 protein [Anoxybacillus gonensis]
MKILLIHNQYKQKGGEDVVFKAESSLLKEKGHTVYEYKISNDNLKTESLFDKIKVGINTIWSVKSYREIKKLIKEIQPDVVHIHNTFPQLSPSIYWAVKSLNIPVVQTLHNYRLTCANGLLYRNSKICEECVKRGKYSALKHKCYRGSFLATLPLVIMFYLHKIIGTYKNKVDLYITLTNFAKNMMIESGLSEDKIKVKPNFVNINFNKTIYTDINKRKKQFVFVGRIVKEKGIDLLLEAFDQNIEDFDLVVIGEGPERENLQRKYRKNKRIKWYGQLNNDEVLEEISKSYSLVMPSKLYETFGMVVIEAFSVGTPVIVPNHAGFPDIISPNENGYLFQPNDLTDLALKMKKIIALNNNWNEFSKNALKSYEKYYTSEKNYQYLMDIYNKLKKNNN